MRRHRWVCVPPLLYLFCWLDSYRHRRDSCLHHCAERWERRPRVAEGLALTGTDPLRNLKKALICYRVGRVERPFNPKGRVGTS
jgi:hypothetical protein